MTEITEGNKLIAEFMGYESDETHVRKDDEKRTRHLITELKYHTSWDWLMPVVEKIEKIKPKKDGDVGMLISIESNLCKIELGGQQIPYEDYTENMEFECWEQGETKIQATWQAVTKFIKWYNQNSKL